jgi:hypothetical protein
LLHLSWTLVLCLDTTMRMAKGSWQGKNKPPPPFAIFNFKPKTLKKLRIQARTTMRIVNKQGKYKIQKRRPPPSCNYNYQIFLINFFEEESKKHREDGWRELVWAKQSMRTTTTICNLQFQSWNFKKNWVTKHMNSKHICSLNQFILSCPKRWFEPTSFSTSLAFPLTSHEHVFIEFFQEKKCHRLHKNIHIELKQSQNDDISNLACSYL